MACVKQWWILVALLLKCSLIGAMRCLLKPEGIITPRSRIDTNRYEIFISGQPRGYAPGETYTIYIRNGPREEPLLRHFKKFIFVLEHEDADAGYSEDQADRVGSLAVIDALTTFNKKCRNSIVETNELAKPEVQVAWTAPESGSGCVIFKASIVEDSKLWFSEDDLIKKLCEQNEGNIDAQPDVLERCNACTEAKYEVTFEGLWSRNTFPHNFPDDAWKTRFSDVIGASHSDGYEFWSQYGRASDELKELAENGNTAPFEENLKLNDENIRTIIKAKGLTYPNTTGRTYAAFRVDKNRHLMSLVASIIPSPDWFVGVSKFELCKDDGSWLESAIFNLYPWDAGTDAGITYTDPDGPLNPGHPIRRIQSNSPNDERSPFYNSDGEEVKPLARLYITRQKVYEKECDDEAQSPTEEEGGGGGGDDVPNEVDEYTNEREESAEDKAPQRDNGVQRRYKAAKCATSDFVEVTTCSVTCGVGFKTSRRDYLNEEDKNDELCKEQLYKTTRCTAKVKVCPGPGRPYLTKDDPFCQLGEWGNFSSCSTNCGVGTKTRSRAYLHPEYEEACEANPEKESTVEDIECYGSADNCENLEKTNTECHYGIWTKCSATCGNGTKARYLIPEGDFENCPAEEVVICYEPPCSENNDDEQEEGLMPKPDSLVVEGSHLPIVNCKVSHWSSWSRCKPHNDTCAGFKTKSRRILVHASNGGKRCPHLLQTRQCRVKHCQKTYYDSSSSSTIDPLQANWGPANPNEIKIDCVVSDWSVWGPCTQTCNPGAMQFRTRRLIMAPNRNGRACPNVVDFRACVGLPNCPYK